MRAGWKTQEPKRPYGAAWEDMFARRKLTRWGNFFWISPAPLLASINDKIVKGLDDLVNEVRSRWLAAQRAAGRLDQGVAVRAYADKEALSFLILGDPGEQDASQYAVIEPLLERRRRHELPPHRQRRDLSRRRHQRIHRRLLPPVRALPAADLRAARKPRLVRRLERVHVPFLRRPAAAARRLPRGQLHVEGASRAHAVAQAFRAQAARAPLRTQDPGTAPAGREDAVWEPPSRRPTSRSRRGAS